MISNKDLALKEKGIFSWQDYNLVQSLYKALTTNFTYMYPTAHTGLEIKKIWGPVAPKIWALSNEDLK